ncbi:hypothetical protein [Gemmatimonas sp. UBA7669]|nr:hypothetical protein [Gemmatimonas sp. UBA7669]
MPATVCTTQAGPYRAVTAANRVLAHCSDAAEKADSLIANIAQPLHRGY